MNDMVYGMPSDPMVLESDEYNGYKYFVISRGTHPCCYVSLPKNHPLFDENNATNYIYCHGGVTYCDKADNPIFGEVPIYLIGWDYAHLGDYLCYSWVPGMSDLFNDEKHWTTEEMVSECKEVIDQIVKFDEDLQK